MNQALIRMSSMQLLGGTNRNSLEMPLDYLRVDGECSYRSKDVWFSHLNTDPVMWLNMDG